MTRRLSKVERTREEEQFETQTSAAQLLAQRDETTQNGLQSEKRERKKGRSSESFEISLQLVHDCIVGFIPLDLGNDPKEYQSLFKQGSLSDRKIRRGKKHVSSQESYARGSHIDVLTLFPIVKPGFADFPCDLETN